MARLILIRHGETDFNRTRRYCGTSNPPLNNMGKAQAKKLSGRLRGIDVEKVYSSDSRRALETASIIFKASIIENTDKLREIDFGAFEGLKYEELLQKHPKLYPLWLNNPAERTPPNGESFADLRKRVLDKLSYIIRLHKTGTIAIVSHGGPLRVILGSFLGHAPKDFWNIEQNTGALNIVEYTESAPPRITSINDTSHLT